MSSKNPNHSRAAGHSISESIGIFTLECTKIKDFRHAENVKTFSSNGSQQSCMVSDPFSLNENSNQNNILITGCTGHIGLALTQKVSKDQKPVVIFRNQSTELKNLITEKKIIPLQIDIAKKNQIEKHHPILEKIQTIVHLAAFVPKKKDQDRFEQSIEQNLLATINLIENTPKCTHFIFASTCEVYGPPTQTPITEEHPLNPTSLYGASKVAAEKYLQVYCQKKNIKLTIVRLTNIYGPGETIQRAIPNFILNALQNQKPIIYGTGEDQRDFMYIDDAINFIIETIKEQKIGVYNIVQGQSISIKKIAENICNLIDKNITPLTQTSTNPKIDYIFNNEKIKKHFTYQPQTLLEEGLKKEIEWFQQRTTLFFDLDGTLLDVHQRIYKAHQDALQHLNHRSPYTFEQYIQLKRQKTSEKEITSKILSETEYEQYSKKRNELIEKEEYLQLDTITKTSVEKIKELKKDHWLILLTNRKNKENTLQQLDRLNLSHLFEEIIICNETETKYDNIQKSLFFNKDAIIIGDTEEEMTIGQKLGIKHIAITSGMRTKEILQQYHPNQLLPNITKINLNQN